MSALISQVLIYATVILDLFIIVATAALAFRKSWGRETATFIGRHALPINFFLALGALVGSLLYSQVIGYTPCELCWWQRIFLYPLVLIYGLGWWQRDRKVFFYGLPMALLAALIALYHSYIQLGGNASILNCTAVGGACAKVYVLAFGYVTIPTMSLSIALVIIIVSLAHKLHADRHA